MSYSQYHPSKGYWWEFKDQEYLSKSTQKKEKKDEPSSFFQRQRLDILLVEWAKRFPPKLPAVAVAPVVAPAPSAPEPEAKTQTACKTSFMNCDSVHSYSFSCSLAEPKQEAKDKPAAPQPTPAAKESPKLGPPPEKKPKIG